MFSSVTFPVMGQAYAPSDYCKLDLSLDLPELESFEGVRDYVQRQILASGARLGWGGYLENRIIYRRSPHFRSQGQPRSVHLGVDVWAPAGTPVFAPQAGKVHSAAYNANFLDYGGTLVLEHPGGWYSLYGHLERAVATRWQPGTPVEAGQQLALLGIPEENGGWEPHLHLQCTLDMAQYHGDFPGVCLPEELPKYRTLCPDPFPLLGLKGA